MKCAKCGQPLESDMPCPNCADDNVRVMSRAEKDSYDGITIEADENEARRQEEAEKEGHAYQYGGQRVYVRHVNLGQIGWKAKLLVALVGLGLSIFFLPLALAFISIAVVLWIFGKFIR